MANADGVRQEHFSLIRESPDVRRARLDDLRRKIAANAYEVPADDVAAAVVSFFSRRFDPRRELNPGDTPDTC